MEGSENEEGGASKQEKQTQAVLEEESGGILECPICLQPCQHPVELPCKHVFCFLCIKGVAMKGPDGKCALCREPIPSTVLTNPYLKDISQLYRESSSANGYKWYYESRGGGWWQYDDRTMEDLEHAFDDNQSTCQVLIAGHLYDIDFKKMIQYRSTDKNVTRRIKRAVDLEKRGVAGIRVAGATTSKALPGHSHSSSQAQTKPGTVSQGPVTRRRKANQTTSSHVVDPPQTTSTLANAPAQTTNFSTGRPGSRTEVSEESTDEDEEEGEV